MRRHRGRRSAGRAWPREVPLQVDPPYEEMTYKELRRVAEERGIALPKSARSRAASRIATGCGPQLADPMATLPDFVRFKLAGASLDPTPVMGRPDFEAGPVAEGLKGPGEKPAFLKG